MRRLPRLGLGEGLSGLRTTLAALACWCEVTVDPVTKEAVQLMLGPPIQLIASRQNRAAREGRMLDLAKWKAAQEKLQEGLRLAVEAAMSDPLPR